MKRKYLAPCLLSLALCLTSCGKAKEDNILNDYNLVKDPETSGISEEEIIEFAPSVLSNVDYEVSVDNAGSNNACVYAAKAIDYNDEYLKSFAANVFDQDTVKICKPYQICNKSELEQELDTLDVINANAEKNKQVPRDYYYRVKKALEACDSTNETELENGNCIIEYSTDYGSAFAGLMKGKIQGVDYALIYTDMNLEVNGDTYMQISDAGNPTPIRLQRLTPAYTYRTTRNKDYAAADSVYGDNLVNESAARNQAEQFLADIGINDFVIEDYGQRVCIINDAESCYDGYSYIFTRQIADLQCPFFNQSDIIDFSGALNFISSGDGNGYYRPPVVAHTEYIRVDVDSEGIALVDLNNLYEVDKKLSSETNILTYNQAVSLANKATFFNNTYELGDFQEPVQINIQFAYLPYQYDNNNAFIPTWFFYIPKDSAKLDDYRNYDPTSDRLLVAINALDGSEINYDGMNIYETMFQDRAYE